MIRYNSENSVFEGYDGEWKAAKLLEPNGDFKQEKILSREIDGSSFSSDLAFTSNSSASMIFRTNLGYEYMRFKSSGDIALSTTGQKISIGSTTPTVTLDIQGTDAVQLTSGTTAERPTGNAGQIRFNTDTSKFEGFDGTTWIDLN